MTIQTRIADLVPNPGVLANVVAKAYATKNTLVASGVATSGPEVDLLMAGGSQLQGLNYINKVDTTQYNHASDDYDQKGAVGKVSAAGYTALRQDINWGWATTDLVRMITKFAPTGYVEQAIPLFWGEVGENIATASLRGAIASDANLTLDLATDVLSLEMLVDAGTAFKGGVQNIFINRKGKAILQKLNINAYVPAKDTDLNVDNFADHNVFVKEDLADGEMIVAGNGALAFGTGVLAGVTPMVITRDEGAGNGQGGEILRTRRSFVVAPQGVSYKGTTAPSLAALATGTNWDVVADLDEVAFRLVKFNAA